MSAIDTAASGMEAMGRGAWDYLTNPIDTELAVASIRARSA